jgi:hypothetical protein
MAAPPPTQVQLQAIIDAQAALATAQVAAGAQVAGIVMGGLAPAGAPAGPTQITTNILADPDSVFTIGTDVNRFLGITKDDMTDDLLLQSIETPVLYFRAEKTARNAINNAAKAAFAESYAMNFDTLGFTKEDSIKAAKKTALALKKNLMVAHNQRFTHKDKAMDVIKKRGA